MKILNMQNSKNKFEEFIQDFEKLNSKVKKSPTHPGIVYTPLKLADFIFKNIFNIYLKDICENLDCKPPQKFFETLNIKFLGSYLKENSQIRSFLENRIMDLKILDPASGTGTFLIAAANNLFPILKKISPNQDNYALKKLIVEKILYGNEIDKKAYLISKLRLISWLFNDEIKIDKDFPEKLRKDELEDINLFLDDFRISTNISNRDYLLNFNTNLNFDIIIGNPPYVENKKILDTNLKKVLKKRYQSAYKLYDLSILFIEKSIDLLNKVTGYLSFIITNKFLAADYGIKIREILINNTQIKEIINISSLPLFANTSTYPIILSLKNDNPRDTTQFWVKNITNFTQLFSNTYDKATQINQNLIGILPSKILPLSDHIDLVGYLYSHFNSLSETIKDLRIIYRPYGFLNWAKHFDYTTDKKDSNEDLLLLGTSNVGKYHIKFEKPIKIAGKNLKISYFAYNHPTDKNWKNLRNQKLIFREIAKNLTFVYDSGVFTNITGLYFIQIDSFDVNNYFSLLTILNAKFIDLIFKTLFSSLHMASGYLRFNGSFIKRIPLPEELPLSLSYFGKILQFLNQFQYNILNYAKISDTTFLENLERILAFFDNLANCLVVFLYLKDINKTEHNGFEIINDLLYRDNKVLSIGDNSLFMKLTINRSDYKEFIPIYNSIYEYYLILSQNSRLLDQIKLILQKYDFK